MVQVSKSKNGVLIVSVLTLLLTVFSCSKDLERSNDLDFRPIKYSCELSNKINNTLFIEGLYTICMEYRSFQAHHQDECYDDFQMSLNFDDLTIPKQLLDLNECEVSVRLIIEGVLKKNSELKYGHLGSNNSEVQVLKIVDMGSIERHPVK
jgi:hypothetical protein